ncbi:MAG TPA: helix-hairpin-helix domain-containing protein [Symbiobacteriaceae bacterium]|nr:helix-hairpin-helix domain-containing protein [Symbiobacteriaceae bacterium]
MAEHRLVRYGVLSLVAAMAAGLVWIGLVRYQAERRAFQADTPALAASPAPVTPAAQATAVEPVPVPAQPELVVVHVAGAVVKPGVYSLKPGARVDDAIAAAGGVLPDGVKDALSLAEHLVDGQKIVVPTKKELEAAPPPIVAVATGPVPTKPPAVKANVNTATFKQLDDLPGVTPTVAQNIVDYRAKNGPFKKLEDLDNVSGIGPATIEKLRPYLTF